MNNKDTLGNYSHIRTLFSIKYVMMGKNTIVCNHGVLHNCVMLRNQIKIEYVFTQCSVTCVLFVQYAHL